MTQNELELYGLSFSCADKEKSFSMKGRNFNKIVKNYGFSIKGLGTLLVIALIINFIFYFLN